MVDVPAPLSVLREKLASPNAETRWVALVHTERHGAGAAVLATHAARMLDDPDPGVQRQAMITFSAIGAAASEAVPVLLELRRRGEPPMLVDRATHGLGRIGPAAFDAVPVLKEALAKSLAARGVLESLLEIAPNDEGVIDAFVHAVFDDDYGVCSMMTMAYVR